MCCVCHLFFSPLKEESGQAGVEDHISQGSEGKSELNVQPSSSELDFDHDYTLISGSSPTHTEDRWVLIKTQNFCISVFDKSETMF